MRTFSTPAILLRRIDFGEADLITTFITVEKGKISAIAKSARKSVKRFGGILDLFSFLNIVCSIGRGKLPILKEASLEASFEHIRSSIRKTAYASYWAEILNIWMEENSPQPELFHLLADSLTAINTESMTDEVAGLFFQMRFADLAGFCPNLSKCYACGKEIEQITGTHIAFDIAKGGIVCPACHFGTDREIRVSKGLIKGLQWMECGSRNLVGRVRFTRKIELEALAFMERFVPFHLGKRPRSLKIIQKLRSDHS